MSGTANAFQKAAAHIEQMRKDCIYTDGALPSRTKALAAMLWSVSVRCEPCLAHYARKAIELGASRDELAEMLAIASVMGGCVGETWALKAFAAVKPGATGTVVGDHDPACCTHG